MTDTSETMIALPASLVLVAAERAVRIWNEGGRERTKVALRAQVLNEYIESAAKTKGVLWWKRATTRAERIAEAEEDMKGEHYYGLGGDWRAAQRLANREAEMDRIASLAKALLAVPSTAVTYVPARLWESINKKR
jgi:hypothetical protein